MKRHELVLAVVAWGSIACSSSTSSVVDAGTDGGYALPANPISPLQACLEIASAEASFEVACGRLPSSDVGDAHSGYIGGQCPPALFASAEADFQAHRLAYDGNAVSCVVNSFVSQGSGAKVACNIGYPEINPSCGQLGWGTIAPGGACSERFGCAIGYFCQVQTGNACGTCAVDADVGSACGTAASGALCSSGACNGSECVEYVGANDGCSEGSAVCNLPFTCHAEGCQLPLGIDGGCSTSSDCANGLSCNVFSSHCLPAPVGGGNCASQPCADGFACSSTDAGLVCAPLIPGGACVATDAGPQCPEQEGCRDGGCVALSQFDGGCSVSADCAVGACRGGICQLLPNGADCSVPTDCVSDLCNESGGTCVAACSL